MENIEKGLQGPSRREPPTPLGEEAVLNDNIMHTPCHGK